MNDTHTTRLRSASQGGESVNYKSKSTGCKSSSIMCIFIIACVVIVGIIIIILAVSGVFSTDSSTSTDCNDRCTANYTEYIQSITNQSQYWTEQEKTDYLLEFRHTNLGQCIIGMNTTYELRPDPTCYLPQNVIDHHLDKFMQYGASSISNTKWAYKAGFSAIGYAPDPSNSFNQNGVQWVSPYPIQTALLQNCSASENPGQCVLEALGIAISQWDMFQYNWLSEPDIPANVSINRVMQVHIFAYDMKDLNLRIPSGNEQGTDHSLWRPGGYTLNGTEEAVVNQIQGSIDNQQYCWKPVTTVNGTWCYPNCEVICENASGCTQTAC